MALEFVVGRSRVPDCLDTDDGVFFLHRKHVDPPTPHYPRRPLDIEGCLIPEDVDSIVIECEDCTNGGIHGGELVVPVDIVLAKKYPWRDIAS